MGPWPRMLRLVGSHASRMRLSSIVQQAQASPQDLGGPIT